MFSSIMYHWIIGLIGIVVLYTLAKRLNHWRLARKWHCGPIPSVPTGFLGITFIKKAIRGRKQGNTLTEQFAMLEAMGKYTVGMSVLGRRIVITRNGENMKAVLSTQFNEFSIGLRQQALRPVIGHGIFASEGGRWKNSREMLRPQFAREQVAHIPSLEPHIVNFKEYILRRKGEPVELQALFHKVTLDVSSEFLFGESVHTLLEDSSKDGTKDLASHFEGAFNTVQDVMIHRLMMQSFYWLVNPKSFKDSLKIVHGLVESYINKALNMSEDELKIKSEGNYTILYELVKQTRDPTVLRDELLSIILAGRNTTACLLTFFFLEMTRNPEVWEKLKQAIYEDFGDGSNPKLDKITFESMKRCTYLKWVINETLRMYPPVSQNMRLSKKDTTLPTGGGADGTQPVFLPKNTAVMMAIYSTHRAPLYYGKDSNVFRPDRWENLKPGWAFMPFGSGARICLGQQFALTEASYTIIRMAQEFPNLKATKQTAYPPKIIANAVMRLQEGLTVSLS